MDDGYADVTVKSKLWVLANFGQWLGRRGLSVTNVDERLVEAFVKGKKRVRRGDLRTLQQFLDHLRKGHIVPDRKLVSDKSPLADILSRYEKYLRSERGLVTVTIINYQPFVRKFLVERFRERPFSLRKLKPSDISDFVLRHCRRMSVRRAQLMTTAFRSFFRFLFQHGELQVDLAEEGLSTCSSTRRSYGPSSTWRRSLRHRAVARTRIRGNNTDVSPGRYAIEGESAFAHCTARRQTNTIPT
jgi:Phage integrase, N-terminal SAM-like domain